MVDCIAVPNDGVDELVERTDGRPYHVEDSAGVPGLKVPWQGDGRGQEAEEEEGGVDLVRDGHGDAFDLREGAEYRSRRL